ncbi:MAG TPA: CHAT domain-containing protein, partial [Longimicrobiaceae bacterium]|nr:CHAT domain-containing protein [Longimicrobiaceae bacterium]
FEAVFNDEVRVCLRGSLARAREEGKTGVRVRLRLNDAPELAELPWEYLYDRGQNLFLSLSVQTPVVRYLELPDSGRPAEVQPPVRVLVMISSPHDYPKLKVEREWELLTQALAELEGRVTVERLERATLAALQRKLRSGVYHVFHFVGHGGFDALSDDGVLVLEDEQGRGRLVSAQHIGTVLRNESTLQLAVLNACEGARGSRRDAFSGTAQGLVQGGLPAVIAMQFPVSDDAAITFTREFYEAVADGYPVDAALAEARTMLYAEENEVEWGTPVLFMRRDDGHLFTLGPVEPGTGPAVRAQPAVPPTAATPRRRRRGVTRRWGLRHGRLAGLGALAAIALTLGATLAFREFRGPDTSQRTVKKQLREAIDDANKAAATAYTERNPAGLERFYEGAALDSLLSGIQRSQGFRRDEVAGSEIVGPVSQAADTLASANVVERWTMTEVDGNSRCLRWIPRHELRQTLFFHYTERRWKIYRIDQPVPSPGWKECPPEL